MNSAAEIPAPMMSKHPTLYTVPKETCFCFITLLLGATIYAQYSIIADDSITRTMYLCSIKTQLYF
jgi:hypothetical protein